MRAAGFGPVHCVALQSTRQQFLKLCVVEKPNAPDPVVDSRERSRPVNYQGQLWPSGCDGFIDGRKDNTPNRSLFTLDAGHTSSLHCALIQSKVNCALSPVEQFGPFKLSGVASSFRR